MKTIKKRLQYFRRLSDSFKFPEGLRSRESEMFTKALRVVSLFGRTTYATAENSLVTDDLQGAGDSPNGIT